MFVNVNISHFNNKTHSVWFEIVVIYFTMSLITKSLKMQTRSSVYKLYTKSKALYILSHQAAVF